MKHKPTALFVAISLAISTPALASPSITIAFSPNPGATQAVVQAISEARSTIHLAAYSFTSKPIAQALINAAKRGVQVQAVLDKSNLGARYTTATFLVNADIPTRIDTRYAIMHDKYIVIDGQTVETGSFNFTAAAERANAENVIVMREMPEVAKQYETNWQRLWAESQPYGSVR